MNIFKVLASAPRNRFSENQVSAMLAWLLNPYMDHGLGYEFLIKFLVRIGIDDEVIKRLKLSITDKNKNAEIKVYLEYEVGESIIDIVLVIDGKYYISIENKIYSDAAVNANQLKIQYECLKKRINEEEQAVVVIVFLVPSEQGKLIEAEYGNLKTEEPDKQTKVTWDEISNYIQDILKMEENCEISPLGEYLRHTLKAFSVFIKSGFKGYNSEKQNVVAVINPKADKGYMSVTEIDNDKSVMYIGVARGYDGLTKIDFQELQKKKFQCTTEKEPPNQFWIERKLFLEYIRSKGVEV
jgi:hypothetical protein